jgi:hypothetical protein
LTLINKILSSKSTGVKLIFLKHARTNLISQNSYNITSSQLFDVTFDVPLDEQIGEYEYLIVVKDNETVDYIINDIIMVWNDLFNSYHKPYYHTSFLDFLMINLKLCQ